MEIFYREKEHLAPGKNQEKWVCPSWKIFLLRLCCAVTQSQGNNFQDNFFAQRTSLSQQQMSCGKKNVRQQFHLQQYQLTPWWTFLHLYKMQDVIGVIRLYFNKLKLI